MAASVNTRFLVSLLVAAGSIATATACIGLIYSNGACYTVDNDIDCVNLGGKCQANTVGCPGGYLSQKCGGPTARMCCKPAPTADYSCLKIGGFCQTNTVTCHDNQGVYVSNKCGGVTSRQCCTGPCSNVRIIPRQGWGAAPPTAETALSGEMQKIFIHHTVGNRCYNTPDCISVVKSTQSYHMNSNGWSDIGYSFLVGDDGSIYEGRGWGTQGAHTNGYNHIAYGISFMGDFTSVAPPLRALTAAKNLIACSVSLQKLKSDYVLLGHRDVKATVCPGDALYSIIKTWPHYP